MKVSGLNVNTTTNVVKNNVKAQDSNIIEKNKATSVKPDETVISEKAVMLNEVMGKSMKNEVLTAKLDMLSKSIENKTFKVDSKAIAEKIVDNKEMIKDILK